MPRPACRELNYFRAFALSSFSPEERMKRCFCLLRVLTGCPDSSLSFQVDHIATGCNKGQQTINVDGQTSACRPASLKGEAFVMGCLLALYIYSELSVKGGGGGQFLWGNGDIVLHRQPRKHVTPLLSPYTNIYDLAEKGISRALQFTN